VAIRLRFVSPQVFHKLVVLVSALSCLRSARTLFNKVARNFFDYQNPNKRQFGEVLAMNERMVILTKCRARHEATS
jgi:hypothetical protein